MGIFLRQKSDERRDDMDRITLISALRIGEVFENPRKGTSTISAITETQIVYIRGGSQLRLPIDVAVSVINDFKGKHCTSNDLRSYHKAFATHGCNCTFLFRIVEKLDLIEGGIKGTGTAGSPFEVDFKTKY